MENHPDIATVLGDLATVLRELRQPGLAPELLSARQAGYLCGVSVATWWRLHSAGAVPAATKLAKSTRWRRAELIEWIGKGCPARKSLGV